MSNATQHSKKYNMASIIYDKTTNGKFLVRYRSYTGLPLEALCDTREEAQQLANWETAWQLRKGEGLCPSESAQGGKCSFREGNGWRKNCLYCHAPRS